MESNKRAIYEEIHYEVRRQMRVLQEQKAEKRQGTADYKWLCKRQCYTSVTERQQQLMENLVNKLGEEELRKSLKMLEITIASESNVSPSDVPDVMNNILKQLIEEQKLAALFREHPKQKRRATRSLSLPKDMKHKGSVNVIETIAAEVETKESCTAEVERLQELQRQSNPEVENGSNGSQHWSHLKVQVKINPITLRTED